LEIKNRILIGISEIATCFDRKPLIGSILLNLICLIFSFFFVCLSYDTNDDIAMMLLSKGVILSKNPSNLILFSSPILGEFFKQSFTFFREINIYTWFYFSLFFILQSFNLYGLLKYFPSRKKQVYSFFLIFFLFCFKSLLNMQFTVFSTLSMISSFLSFTIFLQNNKIKFFAIAFFFATVGILIRPQMAIIIYFFYVIFILLWVIREKKLIRLGIFTTLVIGFFILESNVESNFYKSNKYSYKTPQTYISTYFTDYGLFFKLPLKRQNEIRLTNNWSTNDVEMFRHYMILNTETLVKNNLKTDSIFNDYLLSLSKIEFKKIISSIIYPFKFYYFTIITLVIVFCLFINRKYIFNDSFLFGLTLSYLCIFIYFVICYLFLKKCPERILFSFSLLLIFQLAFISITTERNLFKKSVVFNFSYYVIIILLIIQIIVQNFKTKKSQFEFYENFSQFDLTKKYVSISGINLENIDPFDNIINLNKMDLFLIGCGSDHPDILSSNEEVKNIGYRILLKENHAMIFQTLENAKKISQLLKNYFKEKFNLDVNGHIRGIGKLYILELTEIKKL
jgi:hypothetical protein